MKVLSNRPPLAQELSRKTSGAPVSAKIGGLCPLAQELAKRLPELLFRGAWLLCLHKKTGLRKKIVNLNNAIEYTAIPARN